MPCYHVSMTASCKDGASEDIFNGVNSKRARKACARSLWPVASRRLDQLDSVQSIDEQKSLRETILKRCEVAGVASTVFELISNTVFVLPGARTALEMSK